MDSMERLSALKAEVLRLNRRIAAMEAFMADGASSDGKVDMAFIVEAVSRLTGVSVRQIMSYSRRYEIAAVRQRAYLACHRNGHSFAAIGRHFNRDHTTIMSGVKRADAREKSVAMG